MFSEKKATRALSVAWRRIADGYEADAKIARLLSDPILEERLMEKAAEAEEIASRFRSKGIGAY